MHKTRLALAPVKNISLSISLSIGLSIGLSAYAGNGWSMDLWQAYQAALGTDAPLRAARAGADAAAQRVPLAESQWLPSLTAGGTAAAADTTGVGGYNSYAMALTARQALYRKSASLGLDQARLVRDEADQLAQQELANLAVRVSSAYFDALMAQDQRTLIASQKEGVLTQLDAARKSLAAGSGTRPDIDDAQARLDATLVAELQVSQNVAYTRRQLEALVHQPLAELAALNPDPLNDASGNASMGDLGQWQALAQANSPERRLAALRVQEAEVSGALTKSATSPTLDLVAQVARNGSDTLSTVNTTYTTSSFGVAFSLPLYSGGYGRAADRQTVATLAQAQANLQAVEEDIALRVQREFQGVNEGLLRIRAGTRAVDSAERLVASSRRAFEGGVRSRVDILNAEEKRQTALRDLAQARYDYLKAKVRLSALTGQDCANTVQTLNAWLGASPTALH